MWKIRTFTLLFWLGVAAWAQAAGWVEGRVTDERNRPLADVNIMTASGQGTVSDSAGYFRLALKPGVHTLLFSHLGYRAVRRTVRILPGQTTRLPVRMKQEAVDIHPVEITAAGRRQKEGAVYIRPEDIRAAPNPTSSVKNILISLPSVTQLDELSSQYLVRGGNYDENAVYIDGIEIFRPYLVRSGRQEGLSIVNPSMIEDLYFYAGAYPVELGDKLSSVLQIRYRQPDSALTAVEAGFTGGSLTLSRPGGKSSWLAGLRYMNNTLLVRTMEGDAEYRPAFADAQIYGITEGDGKWTHHFLGYLSMNRYRFVPHIKTTNFGTFADTRTLVIKYEGQEKDRFDAQFAAVKSVYRPTDQIRWEWINSFYHSTEQEYFDILGAYFLGRPNPDLSSEHLGDPLYLESVGAQLDHARNDLDAVVAQSLLRYQNRRGRVKWETGLQLTYENIRDRLREYQVVDSAGFAILPPASDLHPDEPYTSDTLPILPFQQARADYLTGRWHATAYVSLRRRGRAGDWKWNASAGVRMRVWHMKEYLTGLVSSGHTVSPRLQLYFYNRRFPQHRFRAGTGIYMQPPSYREYRDFEGHLQPGVLPQKAFNLSAAHEWTFTWHDFPFKLSTEVYYRWLWDVNPYTVENLRIRYYAVNNAVAYAYGIESRLFGRLLPDTDSWLSLAWMRTEENIDGRGWIPRPTDQRFKMALFFQDYVPGMPYLKMYLNNIFFTGMPTGAPLYADPYLFQFRTRNYWRTDIGLFYVLSDKPSFAAKHRYDEFSVGLEIINMFDRRNSVSNMWIREIYTKQMFGVPNYLVGRVFNLKLKMRF